MSAAGTMNGAEPVKTASAAAAIPAAGSKQPLKSSNNNGKSLDVSRKPVPSLAENQNRKQQPPKAWQGPNPITQRASNPIANGTEKPLPKLPPQAQQTKTSSDPHADKLAHDRSLFLMAQFIGKDGTITLKTGEQFAGVFSGGSFEPNKCHYVMKMVTRTKPPRDQQVNGASDLPIEYIGEGEDHAMTFDAQDTFDLSVQDVNLAGGAPQQNGSIGSAFLTDNQISARDSYTLRARELQRWEPGPDASMNLSLEDSGSVSWDQFAVNEQKYGVQTTYDENMYTTAIDRSNPQFKQRQAEADRIAREIEGSTSANPHVTEERRRDADREDGLDEEEKYSGVKRDTAALPTRAKGAYVPPSQRPITGASTVSGAPFDPAIISAQLSQSTAQSATTTTDQILISTAGLSPTEKEQAASAAVNAPQDLSAAGANAPSMSNPKENTTEDHVRGTVDAFKQFANNEKLRMRQAQEAKRSNQRQEKNVKLNDLKKFAANFKLKSRVPDDLVPILAKDREKQLEIQAKAEEAAKEEEHRSKTKDDEKPASVASPPTPSSVSQPAPVPAATQAQQAQQAQHTQHTQHAQHAQPPQQHNNHRRGPSQTHVRPPPFPQHGPSPRAPLSQRLQHGNPPFYARGGVPPSQMPAELRIPPPGPTALLPDVPVSPASATRLNVNAKAFEFRPAASAFTPSGVSPSPQRTPSNTHVAPTPVDTSTSFFDDTEKSKEVKPFSASFDTLKRMAEAEYPEDQKKLFVVNGGVPQAYRTTPTWPVTKLNDGVTYLGSFPKTQAPSGSTTPMHTPNLNVAMPPTNQMPPHMQGPPVSTPSQRQPYLPPPQHAHATSFDPRFQQFGPGGSAQNSPRAQHLPMSAAFNQQMPQMPMQQYPGQPMPGYGMSPSLGYRQMQPPNGPMMMMPGQGPPQMGPMRPGYPSGPQFSGPQMGGHMMVQQHSGGYVNGPMPQQGYSPMPPHAQPHMAHVQHGGSVGYSGSPRPPMMQHQGSHQGYQSQMHMPPQFAPSPGQPHGYHMQQRAMSAQFPQMTPRQQHAIPHHPSPGMASAAGQGDEGK